MTELSVTNQGPLAGVRILDMTSVVFGSYATQILGDMGADVIKIEAPAPPGQVPGDSQRKTGPTPAGGSPELGPIFMTINRNKRSVLLDLRDPKGLETLKRLIATADVLAASVRYDALCRLGLSYEEVSAIRPDIIYAHAAGYGSDGPYAGEPAYDDLIQACSGMGDLLHRVDGSTRPSYFPSLIADKVAGLFMANAVSGALFHRSRTGEGQFVEVPMLECVTSFNLVEHLFGHVFDPPTGPWTYTRVTTPNRRPYQTADGFIGILPYSDKQWRAMFSQVIQQPDLVDDPRFGSLRARVQNMHVLYQLINDATRTRPTAEWLEVFKGLDIPAKQVNRLEDIPSDPHFQAVGLLQRMNHPAAGDYFAVRPPVRYSKTPASIRLHPPLAGEHNEEVLGELDPRTGAE
jgi:crotonobetainyl-CoA:carnitine CoA-transferase CaiB-like acyl-CoA transferase